MAASRGDPPAVARQRVRRALRRFREGTPLSQGDVAKKLGWSLSKMQRIESGEVAVSVTDLRALLDLYEVTESGLIERLTEDARTARRQRYLTAPEHREHLTPALLQLVQFEREAAAVRVYQSQTYPGVLQTPAVAESILGWRSSLTDDERRVRYEVRMSRRRQLIEEADGPEFYLVLDQSVITRHRPEDARVYAEQLEYIAQVAERPRVHIRIVPFTRGAYWPGLGAFQILDLREADGDAILYREVFKRDEIVDDPEEIKFYREAFDAVWDEALSEKATVHAVRAESSGLRASLDQ